MESKVSFENHSSVTSTENAIERVPPKIIETIKGEIKEKQVIYQPGKSWEGVLSKTEFLTFLEHWRGLLELSPKSSFSKPIGKERFFLKLVFVQNKVHTGIIRDFFPENYFRKELERSGVFKPSDGNAKESPPDNALLAWIIKLNKELDISYQKRFKLPEDFLDHEHITENISSQVETAEEKEIEDPRKKLEQFKISNEEECLEVASKQVQSNKIGLLKRKCPFQNDDEVEDEEFKETKGTAKKVIKSSDFLHHKKKEQDGEKKEEKKEEKSFLLTLKRLTPNCLSSFFGSFQSK